MRMPMLFGVLGVLAGLSAAEGRTEVTRAELKTRSYILRLPGPPERQVVVGTLMPGLRLCVALPDLNELVAVEEKADRLLWTARLPGTWSRLSVEEGEKGKRLRILDGEGGELLVLDPSTGKAPK